MALSKDLSVQTVTTTGGNTSQANGSVANGDINIVTITTSGDALVMPASLPKGSVVWFVNTSANAGVLFPASGGAGNGGSANASVVFPASKITIAFVVDNANNFRTSTAGF